MEAVITELDERAERTLKEVGLGDGGAPLDERKRAARADDFMDSEEILAAADEISAEYGPSVDELLENPVAFEASERAVNISIDDVGVKKQKDERRDEGEVAPKGKRERIQHTVAHVQSGEAGYALVGAGVVRTLSLVAAFLIDNDLMRRRPMFFADGQRSLKNHIHECFEWNDAQIILDWHHLAKKCAELLSMGMRNRKYRNNVLPELKRLLWLGLVDQAIDYLDSIAKNQKSKRQIKIQI